MPIAPGKNNILPVNPASNSDPGGAGVTGQSNTGPGVLGQSLGQSGVGPGGAVVLTLPGSDGVLGICASHIPVPNGINGVRGVAGTDFGSGPEPGGAGVWGTNTGSGPGVYGTSASGDGVLGIAYHGMHGASAAAGGSGVWGEHTGSGNGVSGTSEGGSGVSGTSKSGAGFSGTSQSGAGVSGTTSSAKDAGVTGTNTSGNTNGGPGVFGKSSGWDGVHGESQSNKHAGVSGINTGGGPGVWASGSPAGFFSGDVQVTGDVILMNSSGDVAEDFDVEDGSAHEEPGTVLVISSSGKLCFSVDPYDTRVAGVVCGAGELKPAIVLQRIEGQRSRSPIALIGKAFCKVDASFGSINAGDLLTTSSTPGHAMKVLDYTKAAGAILGKALRGLENGQGLIPILVTRH